MVTRVSGDDWSVLFADDREGEVKNGTVFRWTDSYCSRMVKGKGPRFAPDSQTISAYREAPINNLLQIGAYIGQPLMSAEGEILGTLCAVDPDKATAFTKTQVTIVESITRTMSTLLAVWLKLDQVRQDERRLSYLAHTDALTGLANRHAWDMLVAEEEKALADFSENALVLIADLDGLKEVNDTFGHAKGDEYLRRAAHFLRSQFRDDDMVARIGGDEFAVFVRSRSSEYSSALEKRIAEAFAQANVMASIGIASRFNYGSLVETIKAADEKMYGDKAMRKRLGSFR